MSTGDKKIDILSEGRSKMVDIVERDKAIIHVSEGIVHNKEIFWNSPSPKGMVIASSGETKIPEESDLEDGQEVSLIVESWLKVVKIIPEKYDNFVKKLEERDPGARKIIRKITEKIKHDSSLH